MIQATTTLTRAAPFTARRSEHAIATRHLPRTIVHQALTGTGRRDLNQNLGLNWALAYDDCQAYRSMNQRHASLYETNQSLAQSADDRPRVRQQFYLYSFMG